MRSGWGCPLLLGSASSCNECIVAENQDSYGIGATDTGLAGVQLSDLVCGIWRQLSLP
jgi:hypothetical protein